jgi:hypothetical protein
LQATPAGHLLTHGERYSVPSLATAIP